MNRPREADGPSALSRRERKRRQGYTESLAHNIAHFVAGWQIGPELDLLPRRGSGLLVYDLVGETVTSDGEPFASEMLEWCGGVLAANLDGMKMDRGWVKAADELRSGGGMARCS